MNYNSWKGWLLDNFFKWYDCNIRDIPNGIYTIYLRTFLEDLKGEGLQKTQEGFIIDDDLITDENLNLVFYLVIVGDYHSQKIFFDYDEAKSELLDNYEGLEANIRGK